MIQSKRTKVLLCLLVALIIAAASVSCSPVDKGGPTQGPSDSPSEAPDETAEPTEEPRPTIVMTINTQKGSDDTEPEWKFDTVKEMEDLLNINLELRSQSEEQDQIMMAGGDLTDIVNANTSPTGFLTQMIEGDMIVPLDDLIAQYAPDIASQTERLDFIRKYLSNDTGKVWGITSFTGAEGHGFYPGIGFFSRWDLYSQLGYPEAKSFDDVVDIVSQMVALEPQTPDGLKTYGIGIFDGWGMWPYTVYSNPSVTDSVAAGPWTRLKDGTEVNNFTDPEYSVWAAIRMFNKFNQLGIFDTDSITQPDSEYANKSTNGQYMIINASWWMTDYNKKQREALGEDTLNGFEMLPVEGSWIWSNNSRIAGSTGFMHVISSKSEHPEAAMKLLNYLNSYDGIRHLMNGSLDTTLEMVDGKLELKEDIIKKDLAGDPEIAGMFWRNSNMFGYSAAHPHPDGQPINLFLSDRAFAMQNTAMDQDYSDHYGAAYPHGVINKFIDEGKMMDYRDFNNDISAAMKAATDDITRIDTNLNEILARAAATAILAKDDAAFNKVFEQTVSELEAAGLAQSYEFWKQAYEEAEVEFN